MTQTSARQFFEDADRRAAHDRPALILRGKRLELECSGDDLALVQIGLAKLSRLDGDMADSIRRLAEAAQHATTAETRSEAQLRSVLVLATAGRTAEAFELGDAVLPTTPPSKVPRLLSQLGMVHIMTKDFAGAIPRLDEAIELARESGDREALGVLLNNRSEAHRETGNADLAEIDMRESISIPALGAHDVSSPKFNLGVLLGRQGLLRASLVELDEALTLRVHSLVEGQDMLDRAEILFIARAVREAEETIASTIEHLKTIDVTTVLPDLYVLGARVAIAAGEPRSDDRLQTALYLVEGNDRAEGIRLLVNALDVDRPLQLGGESNPSLFDLTDPTTIEILIERSHRLLTAGRLAEAASVFAHVGDALPVDAPHTRVAQLYAAARAAQLHGDLDQAGTVLDRAFDQLENYAGGLEAFELRARALDGIVPLPWLSIEIAQARGSAGDLIHWVDRSRRVVLGGPSMTLPSPNLINELERLRSTMFDDDRPDVAQQRESIESRVRFLSWTAERAEGARQNTVSLADLTHPGMLVFAECNDRLVGVCVGNTDEIVDLGPTIDVKRALIKLRFQSSIAAGDTYGDSTRDFDALANTAAKLDALLIQPLIGSMKFDRISIVPTGALQSVPWRLLPSLSARPVSVVSGRYPTASGTSKPEDEGRPQLIAVSGPGLAEQTELADVEALYSSTRSLENDDATCRNVISAFEGSEVLHIAAHGSTRNDDPLLSNLDLTDGPLTAYDIETAARVPDTVVLACCRVGGSGSGHAASYGLATVLAARGARQIIASTVDLSDVHARAVMIDLHRRLRDGMHAEDALASLSYDTPSLNLAAQSLVAISSL